MAPRSSWTLRRRVHEYHSRDAKAQTTGEYEALKASILRTGGNLLPVLLFKGGHEGPVLVYGLRRLQAARELGLRVLALVQTSRSELDAAQAMALESVGGTLRWSVYERGTMLKKFLGAGLFPSTGRMAEVLGWSATDVAQLLLAAELPPGMLAAFNSTADVLQEWVVPLTEAIQQDSTAVLTIASEYASGTRAGAADAVFEALVEAVGA